MNTKIMKSATSVAFELVDRDTDLNELAKIASYQRTHLSGKQLFRLLELMIKDGRYFVRTQRTLGYYQDIQEVCQTHLAAYRQAEGEQAEELAHILGWAVRLMRYYKTQGVPAAEFQEYKASREVPPKAVVPPTNIVKSARRETVTLLDAAKRGKARVETQDGQQVRCSNLPAYPAPRKGMTCRADVMRENDVPQQAIFRGWT